MFVFLPVLLFSFKYSIYVIYRFFNIFIYYYIIIPFNMLYFFFCLFQYVFQYYQGSRFLFSLFYFSTRQRKAAIQISNTIRIVFFDFYCTFYFYFKYYIISLLKRVCNIAFRCRNNYCSIPPIQ